MATPDRERPTSERGNRFAIGVVAGGAGLLLGAVAVALFLQRGVTVVVFNADSAELSDVTVHVTGNSYPVGPIRPGQWLSVPVRSKGESHVEVEFRDADGQRKRLSADCYFEGGYSGTVNVTLNREKVISTISNIDPW